MKETKRNPKKKNARSQHKRAKVDAVHSVYAIRAVTRFMDRLSPAGYNINCYLTLFYNDFTGNGVINPSVPRIKYALRMDDETFERGVTELVRSGWWSVTYNADGEIEKFTLNFIDWMQENKAMLASLRTSLNHAKVMTRYARVENQLAGSIMMLATSFITPKFDDLGYDYYKAKEIDPPHQIDSGDKKAKLCHSVFFRHPKFQSHNPAIWEELAAMRTLPESWTTDSMQTQVSFSKIYERFSFDGGDSAISEAVQAINDSGWWSVQIIDNRDEPMLVMTPTNKFHSAVWESDCVAGGWNITQWELNNGFIPSVDTDPDSTDPYFVRPEKGFHYIYAIKSHKTGKYLIVGQTTQDLQARKNQHASSGSNDEANDEIAAIGHDPGDYLDIVHLATVHKSVCNEYEMAYVNMFLKLGHKLLNKITKVEKNGKTIKPDNRLPKIIWKGTTHEERFEMIDHYNMILDECLMEQGGQEVLWEIESIPKPTSTLAVSTVVKPKPQFTVLDDAIRPAKRKQSTATVSSQSSTPQERQRARYMAAVNKPAYAPTYRPATITEPTRKEMRIGSPKDTVQAPMI